jgi:hypothetical protein
VIDNPQVRSAPATIDPLITSIGSASFPSSSVSYASCWTQLGLTGDYKNDFDALTGACGSPTGMAQYVAPEKGVLNQSHKEDVYKVKVLTGLCYRVLGAGDSTLSDLDIRIQKLDGALLVDEMGKQPVAIVDDDKPWCPDADEDINFLVVLDGPGHGRYEFGIWAGPKSP